MRFRIQEDGREHMAGDPQCSGCQASDDQRWPQRHQDVISRCMGFVHAEIFPKDVRQGAGVEYYCDGCKERVPF